MYNIITKKKHGLELTADEISYFVNGYTDGSIPDYQMSALLMAICLKGMNERETYELTMAMAKSGDMLSMDKISKITADKHSTGGVGDKTSLILAPIAAANGVAVAKMSGRGLGHTGGTIDKLESIEGFQTELSEEEFVSIVNKTGMAIAGQSAHLAPADKKLYALRDVTATVDSIPLIASSIMSKKLAAGAEVIVLDVKTGSGAFMKDIPSAKLLAEEMIKIGLSAGRRMFALITDMNQPLGNWVGNRLEVLEAVECLKGEGPADLLDASLYLSALILLGAGKAESIEQGRELALKTVKNGKALQKFKEFVTAQHGDPEPLFKSESKDAYEKSLCVNSEKSGVITSIDTEAVGMASLYLGGGRERKEDSIDYNVGLYIEKKIGDRIEKGETLVRMVAGERSDLERAETAIKNAYVIEADSDKKAVIKPKAHVYGCYVGTEYHELNSL